MEPLQCLFFRYFTYFVLSNTIGPFGLPHALGTLSFQTQLAGIVNQKSIGTPLRSPP